jgi:hypothetical protein
MATLMDYIYTIKNWDKDSLNSLNKQKKIGHKTYLFLLTI